MKGMNMKQYKNKITEINKRIDYLSQGILNVLKFEPKDERLRLLKNSLRQYRFIGDMYKDVLHYIENMSDVEFKDYLEITSNTTIKSKLIEIRNLRHERRELSFQRERRFLVIKGRDLAENLKKFAQYKNGFEYNFKSEQWKNIVTV